MKPFLSTVTNRIDAKGRVSLPANIRAVIKEQGYSSIVCFPSFTEQAVEGCSMVRIEHFSRIIDELDPFGDERDALAASILAEARELGFDKEGRVKIPADLMEHAGIKEEITFVGLGWKFQLWNPTQYTARKQRMRDIAREHRSLLPKIAQPIERSPIDE